jgi:uncharacterized phage protein (TIGR01671 family)
MRTIKFRAWDNHYKYMNYKVLVGVYGKWEQVKDDENYTACCMWIEPKNVDYKCEPHWTHFEPYHEDIKLMQHTGLKDKNGKEIYEGDILRYSYNTPQIEDENYLVRQNICGWEMRKNKKKRGQRSFRFAEKMEVIGNVYENPELLED